jgi:hypothetical protein
MSGWDDPISVVEDLDPEPDRPPGRFQLRDLVLGVLLLVGVLGFAGWQWWSQESNQSNYTRAVEALTRNDLDQARALFSGASGYRDADSRVADLDQRIGLRDSLYLSATNEIAAGNWGLALANLRTLQTVQPDYLRSGELQRTAVSNLALQTLEGSVALREPHDGAAGLYYRRDSTWVYLPGSDLKSRISGIGAEGIVVYDMPRGGLNDGTRKIMLADFTSGRLRLDILPFSAADYREFRWNTNGVWAFRYGRYSTPGRAPVVNALHGVEAEYMPYGSEITYPISFENTGGAMGEVLADVDYTSDRYLLASWTGAQQWSSGVLSNTIISVSLGQAGGGNHMVYATRGVGIVSARLSRDGRYALVTTFTPSLNGGAVYRLLLLDLQLPSRETGAEPIQLDGVRASPYSGEGPPAGWIASTFIESGTYAGKLLAAVFNNDHTHLRIYDPELPEEPILDVEVPTSTGLLWAVSRSDDRGLVVSGSLGSYSPPYNRGDMQTMPVIEIDSRGHFTQTGVVVEKNSAPYALDLAPDHLAIVSTMDDEDKYHWIVYSISADNLGRSPVRAGVLYTQYMPGSVGFTDPPPVQIGDGLLTYIQGDDLRARTYDGAIDVLLEKGTRALYPNRDLHQHTPALR